MTSADGFPPEGYLMPVEEVSCFSCGHEGPFRPSHAFCVRCDAGPLITPNELLVDRRDPYLFLRLPETEKYREEPARELLYLLDEIPAEQHIHFVLDRLSLKNISIDDVLWIKNLLEDHVENGGQGTIISEDTRTRTLLDKESVTDVARVLSSLDSFEEQSPGYPVPSLDPDQMAETVTVDEENRTEEKTEEAVFPFQDQSSGRKHGEMHDDPDQSNASSPDYGQLLQNARELFNQGNLEEGKELYEQFFLKLDDPEKKAKVLLDRAIQLTKRRETRQAKVDLERCLELNLTSPRVYFNRGMVHFLERDFEEALEDFTTAIELKPDYFQAFHNRGKLYTSRGQFRKALKDAERMMELEPENPLAINAYGLCKVKTGEQEEGISYFQKAIEQDPDFEKAYYNLACVHSLSGNVEEALDWLEKAVDRGYRNKMVLSEDRDLDPVRDHPRFQELKHRLENLTEEDESP